jgi:hypothetical protein
MRRPCGFSLPALCKSEARRVMTESEHLNVVAVGDFHRRVSDGATPKASSVVPADDRVCADRRLANHAGPLSKAFRCSLRVMRRGFSFPSRAAFRYPQIRTIAAWPSAAIIRHRLSRPAALMGSTALFADLIPPHGWIRVSANSGPTCPSSISAFHPIVFIEPIAMTVRDLVCHRDQLREWIRLLGFTPVCGPLRLGSKHKCFDPRSGFLP